MPRSWSPGRASNGHTELEYKLDVLAGAWKAFAREFREFPA